MDYLVTTAAMHTHYQGWHLLGVHGACVVPVNVNGSSECVHREEYESLSWHKSPDYISQWEGLSVPTQ